MQVENMFLSIAANPQNYKLAIRSSLTNSEQVDDLPCIQMDMERTNSLSNAQCTIEGGTNAFDLPLQLIIEPGEPFGPIDSNIFKIRAFDGSEYGEHGPTLGRVPDHHLGTMHYCPEMDDFDDPALLHVSVRLSEKNFSRLWDWL